MFKVSSFGQLIILILGGVMIASFLLSGEAVGALAGFLLVMSLLVFRTTTRKLDCSNPDMVAPIDGRVVHFSSHYVDQRLHKKWQRIDIQRRWFGPWTLYSPLDGRVVEAWLQTNHELGSLELVFQLHSNTQEDFLLILVANSAINYFDKKRLQPGSILGKGSDLGFCTLRYISICVPPKWALLTEMKQLIQARRNILFQAAR